MSTSRAQTSTKTGAPSRSREADSHENSRSGDIGEELFPAAVVEDGAPLASAYQCTGLTHSRTLLPMVDAMLKNADLTLDDINAIAIAAGPGSFTGLRIGIAAVKGLAWAADKLCLGVSTLEAMAQNAAHIDGLIVGAMDARRCAGL
ncbi:MAG: tRNA (adenosine(37)-N6)-threonylcarbamoyltransferase complex dimerization subunit type 1 TsaB [Oscillibacter sp.]